MKKTRNKTEQHQNSRILKGTHFTEIALIELALPMGTKQISL
jgi:hypothetical protein